MKKKTDTRFEQVAIATAEGSMVLTAPVDHSVAQVVENPAPHPPAERILERLGAHWRVIVVVAASATLISWLFAVLQPKRYQAFAVAAVTPVIEGLAPTDVMRGVDTLERRTLVATVAALATTPLTRRQALGPHEHGFIIDAVVLPNTNLVRINVEGENAAETAAVANRVADVLGPQTRAMYKFYRVTTVSAATPPLKPVFPRVGRIAAAGLLIGVLLGAVIAYTLDSRRLAFAR
ncbi:MAG TPA: hypothetical protein VHW00_20535 [Thermoanaerobaculia bacterium]|nr:hypothetical protein [Thermoanaerobaculia bacterium]